MLVKGGPGCCSASLLFIRLVETHSSSILFKNITLKNVVCKMAAILSQPQCLKCCGLMMPYGITDLGKVWNRQWLLSTKALHKPYCQVHYWKQTSVKSYFKFKFFLWGKRIWKCSLLPFYFGFHGSTSLSPLDKMAAFSLTIFSNAFSWMRSFIFQLEFHRDLFVRVQLTLSQHWFR